MHRLPRFVRSSGAPKPRVLLVDDHPGVLDGVSALLDDDFDVAGLATDGRQALDLARQIDPDVIVLDINMPGLDGFQTKRALEQAGSRVPVVFLSAVDADDYVSEAFQCGGRGYIPKLRLARNLASAVDQVLLGRVFVPSLTSLCELAKDGGHAMQVHGDVECFLDGVASFFNLALRRGDATCVIGTDEVREGLDRRLRAAGWNVGGPSGHKRYLSIDTADALSRFMRNGLPDAEIVADIASELDQYRRDVSESESSRLTIFGNMVVPLIADGNSTAAIALESHWNRLTYPLPFLTLCGYPASCFHACGPDVWSNACHEHWAVSHTNDV
jgi:CheY-like chemotaxis protein